jgi:hypothetical protein
LWALTHPHVVEAMGGTPEFAFRGERVRTYRNRIEMVRP